MPTSRIAQRPPGGPFRGALVMLTGALRTLPAVGGQIASAQEARASSVDTLELPIGGAPQPQLWACSAILMVKGGEGFP